MANSAWLNTLVAMLLFGCGNQRKLNSTTEATNQRKPDALRTSPWQDERCRFIDASADKSPVDFAGRRLVYLAKVAEINGRDVRVPITAFRGFQRDGGGNWIGPESDLYVLHKGKVVGLNVFSAGLFWFDNFTQTQAAKSTDDLISDFENENTESDLAKLYSRTWLTEPGDQQRVPEIRFSGIMPRQYAENLMGATPGSSVPGTPKFVSAAMENGLLNVTVSDQSGQMFPSIWIDLDSKKAVKVENYEFDPIAKQKQEMKRRMEDAQTGAGRH